MIITKILQPDDGTEICERVIENTKGFARVTMLRYYYSVL